MRAARSAARNLVTTYYDTSDHRLSRRGLAFRVRQTGKKFIQTLKTANAGEGARDVARRVGGRAARRGAAAHRLQRPGVLDLTGLVLPDELVPTFETRFKRQAVLVDWPDANRPPAQIEVAFDRGAIRANGSETPICEIELELKRGEPRALFELAQSLRALAPVRLQTQDKAARGYALVTGAPPAWHKAKPIVLDDEHAGRGRAAADPGRLRPALDRERGRHAGGARPRGPAPAPRGAAPPALRPGPVQVGARRAGARRLERRAALAAWARWARRATSTCSRPRPWSRSAPRAPDDPISTTLVELVADSRWRAHQTVRETLASERYGDLAFGLACWVARRGWRQGADIDVLLAQRQPVRDFAADILTRRHRQVRKRGRGFAELSAEARHELRIALKKLRYGTEFFAALYPARETERFRKAAARMQDVLGHMNDVAVAQHVLKDLLDGTEPGSRQRAAALGAGQVIGWYGRQALDLEPQAVAAWEEFRAADAVLDRGRLSRCCGSWSPTSRAAAARPRSPPTSPRPSPPAGSPPGLAEVDRQRSSLSWLKLRNGDARADHGARLAQGRRREPERARGAW